MVRVLKHGLMVLDTMAATRMARKMARGRLPLLMVPSIQVPSYRMKSVVMDDTFGQIASSTLVNGRRIRCMDEACSNGPMASNTKATSSMIRDRVWASSNGKTGVYTTANGKTANSMVRAPLSRWTAQGRSECGRTAAIFSGWMITRTSTEKTIHRSNSSSDRQAY